ncbi:uncharacterized protein LOC133287527 [Gastrolobium bilobum]|uniref:uncharacterized protein LOC133287527 n=1 Tax=Gastrolobium bilobum TaxID=150636 RepID=UPI002AB27354|nr:uncharacterized protein LOC133287527 [Gastrolobium bilobum]
MNLNTMLKAFLRQSGLGISRKSTTLKFDPLLPRSLFPFSLKFCSTSSSDQHAFAVSYLINNCGFSPESALKASKVVRFKTSQKPDSVLTFFRNHGFSDSDIYSIIKREPWLLSCDTNKRIFPKFRFLISKGASTSDIVLIVTRNPRFLVLSLENRIIPAYYVVNSILQSDKMVLASIICCPSLLSSNCLVPNVKLLVDNGVARFNLLSILRTKPYVISSTDLGKIVQELRYLGFDPSKSYFGIALVAKRSVDKSRWNEKIDTFRRWGWSEETILEAFRRQPKCMLTSNDKINKVMQFWVNQLGWSSSYLVKGPGIFGYSLENWVIPRALVIQYLLSKGLISSSASLVTPFIMSEKLFLKRFVEYFGKEETSQLLKLYQRKMKDEDKRVQREP